MITKFTKLAVILGVLAAQQAVADTWINVADAANGEKLVASIESISIEKYINDDGKEAYTASSIMRYIGKDWVAPFVTLIDVDECLTKNSGQLVVAFPDNTTRTYFWSDNTKKMYDAQGQFLCGYVKEKYQTKKRVEGKKYQI